MATPRFVRAEIWTNFQAAAGTRLAVIPDLLAASDVHAVSGDNQLTIRLPVGSTAYASLAARRVLRTVFADDSFEEWRILKVWSERAATGGLLAQVEAGSPSLALGDTVIARTEQDGSHTWQFPMEARTAAQHLSDIILPALAADGYTWLAAGTIDPTEPIPLVYDFATPLAAVQYLAEALGVEFQFRRNGTTQYLIDLVTRIGASAPVRYVRQGRDLLRLLRELDSVPMATRVIPKGADEGGIRATMAEAEWRVAAITASTDVTLEDPLGADGPIGENDQLNGSYLEKPNGTRVQITGSVESTQKVLISDTTNLTVGDLVAIRKTSGGEVLDYLESPAQKTVAGYGLQTKVIDLPDLPSTVNRAPNPAMRTYSTGTNAPPDGWEIAPGCGLASTAVDKETSTALWTVGGASAKVAATADGHGIGPAYATIAPTAKRPYVSAFIKYWNETAGSKVRVEVLIGLAAVSISSLTRATASGITTVTVNTGSAHSCAVGDLVEIVGVTGGTTPDGYNGVQQVTNVVDTDTLEYQLAADPGTVSLSSATLRQVWRYRTPGWAVSTEWVELGIGGNAIDAMAVSGVVAKVRIVQDGATASTYYVDAAQITLGSGEGQRSFIEGSGPTRLWQAANLYRRDNAPPASRYEVGLLDLARLDGATWAYEDLALGQTVIAVDADLPGSPVSTRLLDIGRNLLVDGEVVLGLSTRPTDITDGLVRPVRADRWSPPNSGRQKRLCRIRIAPNKMPPASATDAAALVYFQGGAAGVAASGPTVSAVCGGAVVDEALARGARIVGLYASLQNVPTGTVTVDLLRDGTVIATVSSTSSGDFADTTLEQLIGAETYTIKGTLAPNGGSTTCTLYWVELELEVDDA